jgi:ELWxxDGT repeat protein
MIDFKG